MTKPTYQHPWSSGPGEILRHGLSLLRSDTDTNRRLAMIAIDNAVELMMKTFLGLPKRITGLTITRREYQEIAESFPALLDALEKYGADKLDGIDLGAIEWYHRLRNELYHQGNGLTVERDKVEVYAELANSLFKNLFGSALVDETSKRTEMLGEFLALWTHVEHSLQTVVAHESRSAGSPLSRPGLLEALRFAEEKRLLTREDLEEIQKLRAIRNFASHSQPGWEEMLTPQVLERADYWARRLGKAAGDLTSRSS